MLTKKSTLGFAATALVLLQTALVLVIPTSAASPNPTAPLQGVVQRLLPTSYHNIFDFQIVSDITPPTPENKYDVYRVSNANATNNGTHILIEGTSVAALGAGLKYYLEQATEAELTWTGNRFNELPQTPPLVPDLELDTNQVVTTGHVRGSFVPWRYYTNVVSFGYQFAFWNWKRWERELDWMLLSGINLLPAMVGQEYVARQMYKSLNLTDVEIDDFFTGPAFMPWQRMGNIQGSWNHLLTKTPATSAANELIYKNKWIDSQWELQQMILARMQELDITAILPAFQGFVPRALVSKFPDAVFKTSSAWSAFPEEWTTVTYVSQTDPLFSQLTTQYLQLQQQLNNGFKSNFYLLDLYNELIPDCMTPECLKSTTTSVTNALHSVDKDAVWAMQAWFLLNPVWTPEATEAYFAGMREANGTPFIIDLASDSYPAWEATEGFYGYDFGWSLLSDYGGLQGLFGKIPTLLTNPYEVYKQYPANFKGMGVTTETIHQNDYIYQLVLSLPWRDPNQAINGTADLERFVRRRYGPSKATPLVQDAFNKLSKTVWSADKDQESQSKSFIEKMPDLDMLVAGFMGTESWYDETIVVQAWNQLVQSALQEHNGLIPSAFKFDLVDVTREVLLMTILPALHESLVDGYKAYDVNKIKTYGRQIVSLIRDTDRLLSSNVYFSFSAWIREAKESIDPVRNLSQVTFQAAPSKPTKAGYQQFLESNARDLVTWWGPESNGSLKDYASKQYGGLLSSYYLPRWQLFIKQLEQAADAKRPWTQTSDNFLNLTLEREATWQAEIWGQRGGESTENTNGQESVEIVRELWTRWRDIAIRAATGAKI
ncbi:hypothetical protein BG011_001846 [Mortierella polycephala]|uniref:Alpha-N-acetylglucosaminidase n=1 Tax=Mortierella polycephala TaxID=41804 RepID=A0A9P6U4R9_9FUNG|nr:hypothetical protein BG011_001846 [Mortierella polycephala]